MTATQESIITVTQYSHTKLEPLHLTISRNGHKEIVSLSFQPFSFSTPTGYYRCDPESTPCCLYGLHRKDIEEEVKKRCDEKFEAGYWVYGELNREAPSKPKNIPCTDWQGERSDAATATNFPQSAGDERQAKRRCTDINALVQSRDGVDGQTRDEENGQTTNGENSRSHDEEDGHTHDKENVQSCDEENSQSHDEENSQSHDEENSQSHDEEIAEKLKSRFLRKFELGLQRLKEIPKSRQIKNLGPQLASYAADTAKDDGRLVEKLLEAAKEVPKSIGWQLSFHHLFVLYRRRKFETRQRETVSQSQEKSLKKKEAFCEFLGCIVNQLESKWGICASLVYNLLEETKFRASMLRDMRITARTLAAQLITDELLKIDQIVLWQGTQVLNPVFFISSVMGIPPCIAFRNIGIGNLSKYDIQKPLEWNQNHLDKLGLFCGKISLRTLLQIGSFKECQGLKSDDKLITINFKDKTYYPLLPVAGPHQGPRSSLSVTVNIGSDSGPQEHYSTVDPGVSENGVRTALARGHGIGSNVVSALSGAGPLQESTPSSNLNKNGGHNQAFENRDIFGSLVSTVEGPNQQCDLPPISSFFLGHDAENQLQPLTFTETPVENLDIYDAPCSLRGANIPIQHGPPKNSPLGTSSALDAAQDHAMQNNTPQHDTAQAETAQADAEQFGLNIHMHDLADFVDPDFFSDWEPS